MILAGFLVAVMVADVWLTRDAIKRSGGKIREGNRLMAWFMATDLRATLITVAETAIVVVCFAWFEAAGAWWASVAFFLGAIFFRGRVVLRNYRINTDIL